MLPKDKHNDRAAKSEGEQGYSLRDYTDYVHGQYPKSRKGSGKVWRIFISLRSVIVLGTMLVDLFRAIRSK